MPKKHLNEPVKTDDGQELDEDEVRELAIDERENDPDKAEEDLEKIDSDVDDLEQ